MGLGWLRHRRSRGVALAGCQFVPPGAVGGVSTITGSVRTIRQNVVDRLLKHRSLVCDNESLIRNDEQGYYLQEWISVAGEQTTWPVEPWYDRGRAAERTPGMDSEGTSPGCKTGARDDRAAV